MGTLFHDPAAVENQDPVGIAYRRQPVRHDDACAAHQRIAQAGEDAGLGVGIHGAQRIVQDEDGRILRQRPRDRRPLFLPARQVDSPLAKHGIIARQAAPAAPR